MPRAKDPEILVEIVPETLATVTLAAFSVTLPSESDAREAVSVHEVDEL